LGESEDILGGVIGVWEDAVGCAVTVDVTVAEFDVETAMEAGPVNDDDDCSWMWSGADEGKETAAVATAAV
jgi:hypothetical protein